MIEAGFTEWFAEIFRAVTVAAIVWVFRKSASLDHRVTKLEEWRKVGFDNGGHDKAHHHHKEEDFLD